METPWQLTRTTVALARYQSIVDAPDFGHLDYESVDPKATKPTKGAIRVNDLLETITGGPLSPPASQTGNPLTPVWQIDTGRWRPSARSSPF